MTSRGIRHRRAVPSGKGLKPLAPNILGLSCTIIVLSCTILAMTFIKASLRPHGLRIPMLRSCYSRGVHPKIVSERLGHSSIGITLDTDSHVLPGLQEAAAGRFEDGLQQTIIENRKA